MNFDFSDEQRGLQQELRTFLADKAPLSRSRAALESASGFDGALWAELAELGWLGIQIPERFGGSGLDVLTAVLAAEEMGRVLAPAPFAAAIGAVGGALMAQGTPAQQERWLGGLAQGTEIGAIALSEKPGALVGDIATSLAGGRLSGTKIAVADGVAATFAIVACSGDADLALVALDQAGVTRTTLDSLDPSRSVCRIVFDGAAAEPLGGAGALDRLLLSLAVFTSFEELGGADVIFAITREYMDIRHSFGKPISQYQALKHRMADLYAAIELARANAYYAAWALSAGSSDLAEAAACARVSSTTAFELAATEAIQLHGGMGFTWESECHQFYRRAKWLSASLGGPDPWRERLVGELVAQLV
jgi:alkylation response protein AidB-like acyl-CoA dehydrogenase